MKCVLLQIFGKSRPKYKIDFNSYGETAPEPDFDDEDIENDKMYDSIIDWLVDQDSVSISGLQRRFRIGFPRAGRIIDQLERDGYIEGRSGAKSRKVIH